MDDFQNKKQLDTAEIYGTVWKTNPPTVRTVQRVSSLRAVMGGERVSQAGSSLEHSVFWKIN